MGITFKYTGSNEVDDFIGRMKNIETNTRKILVDSLNASAENAKDLGAKAVAGKLYQGEGKNIDINRVKQKMLVIRANTGSQTARIRVKGEPFTFRSGGAYRTALPSLGKSGVTEFQTGRPRFHSNWFVIRLKNSGYQVAAKRVYDAFGSRVKVAYSPSVDQMYDDVIFNRLYIAPVEDFFVKDFFERSEL